MSIDDDILLAAKAATDDLKKSAILGFGDTVGGACVRACNRYQLSEHELKKIIRIVEATQTINGGWKELAT